MMKKIDLKFKPIGWQGIKFQVPEDWNFVVESGEKETGYAGFDSSYSKFELKWEKIKKKKAFSIDAIIDNLIKKMKKSNEIFELVSRRNAKVFGHNAIYFQFKTAVKGYGITWYCDDEEKVFVGLFSFNPSEHEKAKAIFDGLVDSVKCHSRGKQDQWTVFGFSLKVPPDFELKERKFLVGFLTLSFHAEKRHPFCTEKYDLIFQYWSPATLKFKDFYDDPKTWFKEVYEKTLERRCRGKLKKGKFQSFKIMGHAAKILTSAVKRGFISQVITKNKTYIWYCPETNRMYAVTLSKALSKQRFLPTKKYEAEPNEMFNKIVASISCH